ncbi:MAG: protein TolR [Nevskiaceae bacterium]|jgi:biopolymer transport protein TolR|nr:protein TolR [Nevskiaceae bacterium]
MSGTAGRGRHRRLMGEINVVPYIDVMLVLLVIFMVTAPLLTQGVKVELPKAASEPLPQNNRDNQQPLVISIDKDSRVFSSLSAEPDTPLDDAALATSAREALQAAPERDVLIKADTTVAYGRVIGAMVVLQQSGATKIGFLTDPLPQERPRR